jgi:hypothetical protein
MIVTGTSTFNGNVIVPDSTTSTHALRVGRGDARYARKVSAGSTVSPDTGIEITFGDGTTYIINGYQI